MKRKTLLIFVLGLLISGIPLGVLSYYLSCENNKLKEYGSKISSSPISVDLSISPFSEPKGLGSKAELTVTVTSVWDVNNLSAQIDLPEGISFVSGNLTWSGDLHENIPANFQAIIEAANVGNWTIKATARWYLTSDSWYGDIDRLCVSVSEDEISVLAECPERLVLPPSFNETGTSP